MSDKEARAPERPQQSLNPPVILAPDSYVRTNHGRNNCPISVAPLARTLKHRSPVFQEQKLDV